eukprot:17088_1
MPPKTKAKPESKSSQKKMTNSNKSGSKGAAKKWSMGKTREALENAVLWDPATIEKLEKDVPKYKVITPSIVSDRLKVSVALATQGLKHLAEKKLVKLVSNSAKFKIYTRAVEVEEEVKDEKASKKASEQAKKDAKDLAKLEKAGKA